MSEWLKKRFPLLHMQGKNLFEKKITYDKVSCTLIGCVDPVEDKKNLVLIHGLASGWNCWGNNISDFAAEFNVYIYDMPWNCNQPCPFTTFKQVSDWTLSILKKSEIREPIVLGHSYGAAVVLNMVLNGGVNVIKKQMLCSVLWPPVYSKVTVAKRIERFLANYLDFIYYGVHASIRPNTDPEIAAHIYKKALEIVDQNTIFSYLKLLLYEANHLPEIVNTPTLLIMGASDNLVSTADVMWLNKKLKGSQYIPISEARHFPMMESKKEFHEIVRAFCAE